MPALVRRPGLVPDRIRGRPEGLAADALGPGSKTSPSRFESKARTSRCRPRCICAGISPNQTLPDFFNPLVHHIETLFKTGTPPYPVERTLLTTGVLAAAVDSLHEGQKRIDTPDLRRRAVLVPSANRPSGGADADGLIRDRTPSLPRPRRSPIEPASGLAIITTVWRYLSHAQHMGDRFLVGYPWQGKWHRPAIDVVALYVDQKPEG